MTCPPFPYPRPVVYVAARKHNTYERDIDKLKKFLVYILVSLWLFVGTDGR